MAETRKLAAILAADVVGYSRLAGSDEERTLARLRALRSDLIDPTIAVHNGRVVNRTGDGVLIEFRSVVDAVRCVFRLSVSSSFALAFMSAMSSRRVTAILWAKASMSPRDWRVSPSPVPFVCPSKPYWQVKSRLDLAVSDLGAIQLKNIADPVRAYSLEVGKPAQAKPTTEAQTPKEAKPMDVKKRSTVALAATAASLILIVGPALGISLARTDLRPSP
jgi:adenylate cyclase